MLSLNYYFINAIYIIIITIIIVIIFIVLISTSFYYYHSYYIIRRRLNIDFSNIPDDQPYADKVYVESINKTYHIDK